MTVSEMQDMMHENDLFNLAVITDILAVIGRRNTFVSAIFLRAKRMFVTVEPSFRTAEYATTLL